MSYSLNIVGGGMVGASLALALQDCVRQAGWTIRLIEAQPPVKGGWQPSYDNRSTALSHGSRRLFERLGIWQELARRAGAVELSRPHDGRWVVMQAPTGQKFCVIRMRDAQTGPTLNRWA